MSEEKPADELSYGDAAAELEAILEMLDDDTIDVDLLADRVRRAAELVRACRARIAGARLEIERVVAELEAEATEDGSPAANGSPAEDDGAGDVDRGRTSSSPPG